MDAFISHSSADSALASRIEEALEHGGFSVWLDRSEIRVGALLRDELQSQIEMSRAVILLWSKPAAGSRWVAAELLTAFHLDHFIIPCVLDRTRLPQFLQNTVYLDFGRDEAEQIENLRRAVREAPRRANTLQPVMSAQSQELKELTRMIAEGQMQELKLLLQWKLAEARELHALVNEVMRQVEKKWRLDATVLNLAGYHRKNEYLLKHWEAINAGRPPKDRLLERAERFFFETLFVEPTNYEALNGLSSILIFERDLNAAEFFNSRALHYAESAGVDYPAARQDRELILRFKRS